MRPDRRKRNLIGLSNLSECIERRRNKFYERLTTNDNFKLIFSIALSQIF